MAASPTTDASTKLPAAEDNMPALPTRQARGKVEMRTSLIIAAGGLGSRFRKSFPAANTAAAFEKIPSKLFLPLDGQPVLIRTLAAFRKFSQISETVVALPKGSESATRRLLTHFGFDRVKLVRGGKTRAESVWNALQKSDPENHWVMVHDGARPFVSREALQMLLDAANKADGVILAKKVVPTIKEADGAGKILRTVDRSTLYEAETPQLMRRAALLKAYKENPKALEATDESSLLESVGARVKIMPHETWNPKITTHKDFQLAEAYLQRTRINRTGFGRDIHRLVTGRKLYLGGIKIPFEKGALGHSDGDALLHAVADAMLGAIGGGDIGEWFSDKNPKFKNVRSEKILLEIIKEAHRKGWKAEHVDTVIILEKPKLGIYKQKIRKKIAALLELKEESVSIKAKTMEGLGPEGQGLAVSAEALVAMTGES